MSKFSIGDKVVLDMAASINRKCEGDRDLAATLSGKTYVVERCSYGTLFLEGSDNNGGLGFYESRFKHAPVESKNHRFNIGDKVVLDMDSASNKLTLAGLTPGVVYEIGGLSAHGERVYLEGSRDIPRYDTRFKPAPVEAPKFKMGDLVRYRGAMGVNSKGRTVGMYVPKGPRSDVPYVEYAGGGWDRAENLELVPVASAVSNAMEAMKMFSDISLGLFDKATPVQSKGEVTSLPVAPRQFWITAVLDADGNPQPAAKPKVHRSPAQAAYVGKVMAEKHPGETFVTLQVTEVFHAPKPAKPSAYSVKFN